MASPARLDRLSGQKVANNEEKKSLTRGKVSNMGKLDVADLLKCTPSLYLES